MFSLFIIFQIDMHGDIVSQSNLLLILSIREIFLSVTPCTQGTKALKLLHAKKKRFDLIVADAEMMDINVFKFIETVQSKLDIPIVLMSEVYKPEHERKAINCGVSDVICTPTIRELMVIWKFVYRKLSPSSKNSRNEDKNTSDNEITISPKNDKDENNIEITISSKNDKDENTPKKPRWRWTDEMHEKFIFALKQLGLNKASPKKILELMDAPNLAKLTVSSYLQIFRECVEEKGIADWTQITSEMISNQIQESKFRSLNESKQRSMSLGRPTMPEQSNSITYMHRSNASIMSGVNTNYNHTRNIFSPMQQNYSPVVNQTDNNFSPMARNQLNMGHKYAPTSILPKSSAAVAQTQHFLPLRNAYSLLNQLQSKGVQIGRNDNYVQHNNALLSNWLGNESANRVQNSNAIWNSSANMVQSSNATGHCITIQGINNFGTMQNSNDVNQGQICHNDFTGNIVYQNTNAMESNSANQGIGGFEMIQNSLVGQNKYTEAPLQGYNVFTGVNENSIAQNHNTVENNSVIQSIGAVGMMQNNQIGIYEHMGAPYQGQGSIGVQNLYTQALHQDYNISSIVNENSIGQSHNTVGNNFVIQSIGAIGIMQNHPIGVNGQSSTGALNGNFMGENLNALVSSSAVQGNGGVGMMQSPSFGENAYNGVQGNGENAFIGNSGVGSSEKAVDVDDFVQYLLNLDAEGEEPNN